jgi:serine phosphatase RsbU (regulator of sigma subunit)
MLEGFDLKWNYSNRNLDLPYSKLPPGDYCFKVEVSLDKINWFNSKDSSFCFTINPPFWRRWWFILAMIFIAVSSVYLYVKRRLASLERAKKELEEEVYKRTEEIRNQNEELETQKEEIQASIRYAYRIQTAALPPKAQLDLILGDYFVLNKPRDIVSGDFFWVARDKENIFFSVGDCTGHGVPGSFMSMLGLSALNDIVKSLSVCKASLVLNLLKNRIMESLHQDESSSMVTSDGMDISLCILNTETKVLQFAAAHNPLYYIRNE